MKALASILIVAVAFQNVQSVAAATPAEQAARASNLPADVRDFIGRRANCDYWRSEETSYAERTELGEDDYDAEREAQIQSSLKRLRCSDLAKDEAALKQRYANNRAVINALNASKNGSPG